MRFKLWNRTLCWCLFCGFVCNGVVVMVVPCSGSSRTDHVADATGLKGDDLKEFEAQMDHLRISDRELLAGKDVSAGQAKRMTTKELVMQTLRLRLFVFSMLYPDSTAGMYRAAQCSNSMAELLSRRDFAKGFIRAYSRFDANPKTNPKLDDYGGALAVYAMDTILDYPPLQGKLVGHEKEILLAVCMKHWELEKINVSYPKGQEPYGGFILEIERVQRLARRVFPNALINSVNSPDKVDPAIKELQRLCSH